MIKYLLLILPIHRRSYKQYYNDHEKYVSKMKAKLEERYKDFSYDKLGEGAKNYFEEMWFWPPWIVNDVMGFLNIRSDYGGCLIGDIFLKRKYFHRDSIQRYYKKYNTTLKNNEFLYYSNFKKHHYNIDLNDNDTYVKAVLGIIEDSKKIIGKHVSGADLWLPGYDLSCLNLADADKQLRERKPGEP